MRIALAHNLRTEEGISQAERLPAEEVATLAEGIASRGYTVIPVEVSGPREEVVDKLLSARADLVFNVAEGDDALGPLREAFYPALYRYLGLPFTGGGAALLFLDIDKRLSEKVLAVRGVRIPEGAMVTPDAPRPPKNLPFPLFVKPNYEGSSKGITKDSVVRNAQELEAQVERLLADYPAGVLVEQFIEGREFTVPMLEGVPGKLMGPVEHVLPSRSRGVYGYEEKQVDAGVEVRCPADLTPAEHARVMQLAEDVFQIMPCPDMGRVDIRLTADGTPYFIELNPLPRLLEDGSVMVAARERGLSLGQALDTIVRTASARYGIESKLRPTSVVPTDIEVERCSARSLGIDIGRFPSGRNNDITDVADVLVGHVTHCRDDFVVPDRPGTITSVCTGVTAIVPCPDRLFDQHVPCGGFVLNGIGEMTGLLQVLDWGWLETPIMLTNTMSVGRVHDGVIDYMLATHPELGEEVEVVIPIVAETNNGFLNDNRARVVQAADARRAIQAAGSGPIEQGSVGGGAGMISFDFAGGIGSASRVLPPELGGYTVGVLLQSNFGRLRNLTIGGQVVGRELDAQYPYESRRGEAKSSVIVVVATDAPLLAMQLNHLAKRAALGLGRVGSYAAPTSGEITLAFTTANSSRRATRASRRTMHIAYTTDHHLAALYEAAMEATEEAVVNAMTHSTAMRGRRDRLAPAIPLSRLRDMMDR